MLPFVRCQNCGKGDGWTENGEPLWCADEMIPQKLTDVLGRDTTEMKESDAEIGKQEYAADGDTDSSSDGD